MSVNCAIAGKLCLYELIITYLKVLVYSFDPVKEFLEFAPRLCGILDNFQPIATIALCLPFALPFCFITYLQKHVCSACGKCLGYRLQACL